MQQLNINLAGSLKNEKNKYKEKNSEVCDEAPLN